MKRAFTQKANLGLSCETNNDALAKLSAGKLPGELADSVKPNSLEANRRVRTSAAMIGLAISVGTSGLLLPQQGEEAMAAEPTPPEPTFKASSASRATAVALPPTVEPEISNVPKLSELAPTKTVAYQVAPHIIEHEVKPGQTLWQLSQHYQVDAAAIAASNDFKPNSVLPTGKIVKVPSVNGIVHQVKPGDTIPKLSQYYGVDPTQIEKAEGRTASASLPVGESVLVPGNVNNLLRARQDIALNQLQERRDRLQNSLAELRSEESTNTLKLAKLPNQLPAAKEANPLTATKPQEVFTLRSPAISPMPSTLAVSTIAPQAPTSHVLFSQKLPASTAGNRLQLIATPNPGIASVQKPEASAVTEMPKDLAIAPPATPQTEVDQIPSAAITEIKTPSASIPRLLGSQPTKNREQQTRSSLTISTLPTSVSPIGTTDPLPLPKTSTNNAFDPSTIVRNGVIKPTVLVAGQPSQSADSDNNPYVEKLREDIIKLREQYRTQNNGQPSRTAHAPATAATLPSPAVPTANNQSAPSRYINPEFSPNQYNRALQAESQRLQPTRTVQAPVPPKAPAFSPTLPNTQRQIFASAPSEANTYNPLLQSPVGQTVAPELPPLPGPNPYLPNSPNRFNGYIWPSKGLLTSGYGWRWGRMHKGIDIAAPVGTPVVAAAPGVVVSAGWNSGGYGNLVEIQHPDGSLTRYAHNNKILVRPGQMVDQGQQISEMGSTGYSTGPHCHFEVHPAGQGAVNPMAFLPSR